MLFILSKDCKVRIWCVEDVLEVVLIEGDLKGCGNEFFDVNLFDFLDND